MIKYTNLFRFIILMLFFIISLLLLAISIELQLIFLIMNFLHIINVCGWIIFINSGPKLFWVSLLLDVQRFQLGKPFNILV